MIVTRAKWGWLVRVIKTHSGNLCCLFAFGVFYHLWINDYLFIFPKSSPAAIWLATLFCIGCAVPANKWGLAFLGWALMATGLMYANEIKIKLVQFPITEQDIEIVLNNPGGFFDAVGVSKGHQYAVVFFMTVSVLFVSYKTLRRNGAIKKVLALLKTLLPGLIFLAFSLLLFKQFYIKYGIYVHKNRDRLFSNHPLWRSDSLVYASRRLMTLGFLPYSHAANRATDPALLGQLRGAQGSASAEVISQSVSKFIVQPHKELAAPNIVFILAESTFNPHAVFSLNKKVDNSLFSESFNGLNGLLHVTPVGGGTWITEFETITGLDSRLFGFMGQYTHASLSPYVKKSFATYLKSKGYMTAVFYPVAGNFYSARVAYQNYGFGHFHNAHDLALETDWSKFSDEKMADRIISELPEDSQLPFFDYVVLLENHPPYPCKNFENANQFSNVFKSDNDFNKNCQLNEFIKRAKSTESAFLKIIQRLRDIEAKTGRPFVAVIFGDHQPYTFLGREYEMNRSTVSKFYTFYAIAASMEIALPKITGTFHATFIPTLVSALTAKSQNDIYLPENIFLYEKCGDMSTLTNCSELLTLAHAYRGYINYEVR